MKPYSLDDYVGANQYNSSMMEKPEVPRFGNSFFDDDQMGTTDPAKETQDASDTARVNELYNKLQRVRELQSGELSPSQAWAGGLLSILPGLAGLATGGNEGAAIGFDAGGKIGGGYLQSAQKQNYKAGEDLKELIKQDTSAENTLSRTLLNNELIRQRGDHARDDTTNEMVVRKQLGVLGAGAGNSVNPADISRTAALLSARTGVSLEDAEAVVKTQKGATSNFLYSTGLNKKLAGDKLADQAGATTEALKSIEELKVLAKEAGGGIFGGIKNIVNENLNASSPQYKLSARAGLLAKKIASAIEAGGRLSDQDFEIIKEVSAPNFWLQSGETINKNFDYLAHRVKQSQLAIVEAYKGMGREIGGVSNTIPEVGKYDPSSDLESAPLIDEVETLKSYLEMNGEKVVDETVPPGMKRQKNIKTGEIRYVPIK